MSIESWFTEDDFEKVFPYSAASAVYTDDLKPFWTYSSFIEAIKWMNAHQDKRFHGFCTESRDQNINRLELAAFLANTHQETGDPSLNIPYPWWPVTVKKTGPEYGPAGGLLCIIEGACAAVVPHPVKDKLSGEYDLVARNIRLTKTARDMIGLDHQYDLTATVSKLRTVNQPGFGLGTGTAAFQPGLVAVSDDGTLYGDNPQGSDALTVKPSNTITNTKDRAYASGGVYSQYGGRGAIQLSYNYNYSTCSLELFGDYRLARYPNLIITTDRTFLNGKPEIFGFPGTQPNGNNKLPLNILRTTPPARMMAWITAICFWMLPRSGRSISCHQCMLEPTRYGITCVNLIVNNDSGCKPGWAYNKVEYYKRICSILGISHDKTIVCPPNVELVKK
jgi:hypothetical protein